MRLRRFGSWGVPLCATTCFAAVAAAVTVAAAIQRRHVWTAAAPHICRALADELRRRQVSVPDMTAGIDLQQTIAQVPDPRQVIGPMAGQVLVQTLIFAAVCSWTVALRESGHRAWSALAGGVPIIGIVTSSGPLALLPGTLAGQLSPTGTPGTLYVPFETPLWWRLMVAAAATMPIAGAWLATPVVNPDLPVGLVRSLSALALLALVGELTVLALPQSLVPDSLEPGEARSAWLLMLLLAACAAVAGTACSRSGQALAMIGTTLGLAAVAAATVPYHLWDQAQQAFGWDMAPGQPVWHLGTPSTVALVLLAPALGWLAASLSDAARRRLPTPGARMVPPSLPYG